MRWIKVTTLTILTLVTVSANADTLDQDSTHALGNEVVRKWASGVYLYSVSNGSEVITRKMMLLK